MGVATLRVQVSGWDPLKSFFMNSSLLGSGQLLSRKQESQVIQGDPAHLKGIRLTILF